jgi:hypothetical protein
VTRPDPEDPDVDDVVDEEEDVDGDEDQTEDEGVFASVCPFCGEADTLSVDQEQPAGSVYVEDCTVCCQPMKVTVIGGPGRRRVQVDQD